MRQSTTSRSVSLSVKGLEDPFRSGHTTPAGSIARRRRASNYGRGAVATVAAGPRIMPGEAHAGTVVARAVVTGNAATISNHGQIARGIAAGHPTRRSQHQVAHAQGDGDHASPNAHAQGEHASPNAHEEGEHASPNAHEDGEHASPNAHASSNTANGIHNLHSAPTATRTGKRTAHSPAAARTTATVPSTLYPTTAGTRLRVWTTSTEARGGPQNANKLPENAGATQIQAAPVRPQP